MPGATVPRVSPVIWQSAARSDFVVRPKVIVQRSLSERVEAVEVRLDDIEKRLAEGK